MAAEAAETAEACAPAAASAAAAAISAAGAAAPLELKSFPKTFQSGAGARQLELIYAALDESGTPLAAPQLAAMLDEPRLTVKRIELLLDVMVSRKVVAGSAAGWSLVPAA